jgi:thiol-disulfide isomerase/thioredoxin
MKIRLGFLILLSISFSAYSQSSLPPELKGNWLNTCDSIEWIVSFQPGFAVYENQFWDYKSILFEDGGYLLQLNNTKINNSLSVKIINETTLLLSSGSKKDILCTNRKAAKPDFRYYDTLEFNEPLIQDDSITIRGFIEDYDNKIYQRTGNVSFMSVLSVRSGSYNTKFDIRNDGRFEVTFRGFNPSYVYFEIEGGTNTRVFVFPGQTVMIGFNSRLNEVTRNSEKWAAISDWDINHYMGCSGMLSEELLLLETFYEKKLTSPMLMTMNMESMSQLEYLEWRTKVNTKECSSIDSLIVALRCSRKAAQYMQKTIEIDLLTDLYNYPVQNGNILQLEQKYIDGIPKSPNSETDNISPKYYRYINYLTFFHRHQLLGGLLPDIYLYYLAYSINLATDMDEKYQINDLVGKIKEFQVIISKENSLNYYARHPDTTINRRVQEIKRSYSKLMKKYDDKIPESFRRKVFIKELDFIMQCYNKGLTAQMYAMHWLLLILKNSKLHPEFIAWAKQNITHPVLFDYLNCAVNKTEIATTKFTTYAENTIFLEHISSEEGSNVFFEEILDMFKGNVIYIDFWADWCSPCRAGFKPTSRLKEELSGRDVVFLYFGISCKIDNWKQVIMSEQLSGYHYWLNEQQGQVLKQKLGFSGIPHYLVVDKTGQLYEEEAPPPHELVRVLNIIEELLKR